MANELTDDDLTDEEDLTLEPQQAGMAFRAEMWAMDTLLGYWPYLIGGLAVILGAIFFYGQYSTFARNQQRFASKQIAQVEEVLPERVAALSYLQAGGQPIDIAQAVEAAVNLEAVEATGAARTEAMLKAAELYRIAAKPEEQRMALEVASSTGTGVLHFVAESAIANLELEAGENDAAVKRLRALSQAHDDYLGEQAALDLGLILEQLDRKDEALAVYSSFLSRWTDSPRSEDVRKRQAALGED